jgi:cation diffusion facilitator family transporter
MNHHHHHHDHSHSQDQLKNNEQKTLVVIVITFVMMIGEIVMGNLTGSMALTADGWHMASHAGALAITYLAYRLHRSKKLQHQFTFGPGKFIPLGGYTSAVCLGLVALFMIYESLIRLMSPVEIRYNEAIAVAILGLIVNVICALILKDDHNHDHEHGHGHDHHHDHNLKSAYMHVLADALTSVFAIGALLLGKFYQLNWMDALVGILGGIVIFRWAIRLCKETAFELLDGHAKAISHESVLKFLNEQAEVTDLHIWKIAPNALACEVILVSKELKGAHYYRALLKEKFSFKHIIIEERQSS